MNSCSLSSEGLFCFLFSLPLCVPFGHRYRFPDVGKMIRNRQPAFLHAFEVFVFNILMSVHFLKKVRFTLQSYNFFRKVVFILLEKWGEGQER